MDFLVKYKKELLILIGLLIFYFILRLPNLTLQPIFADEAIYIRWAQVMKAEPTLRFLPLSDGKTPLFMWLMIPLFKIFDDPLYAGRFLSIISGFLTLLGAFFLGWRFFNFRTGLWSALFITITPLMVFFDRMALVDSLLTAFSIWSLNLALLLIKSQRLDVAMFLGYSLGGGLLTKTPGMFNLLSLPFTALACDWSSKGRQGRMMKMLILWGVAVGIAILMYNVLRLGPGFTNLSSRNQDYIFSPWELTGRPLDPFLPHLGDLRDWLPKLLTWPILVFSIVGAVLAVVKRDRLAVVILLWGLIPLLIQMALLKTFTARYILFSFPPLLCLAGWAISYLGTKIKFSGNLFTILIVLFLLPLPAYFNFYLLTDPAKAPLPREERSGYFEEWTAGYGFPNIAKFLMQKAQQESIVVGTEGSFGTLPDGIQIYLDDYFHQAPQNKQISIISSRATISAQLRSAALEHPTYFIANKSRFLGDHNVTLLEEYPKATRPDGTRDAILLFRVFSQEELLRLEK